MKYFFAALFFLFAVAGRGQSNIVPFSDHSGSPRSAEERAVMQSLSQLDADADFVRIEGSRGLQIDLRYASENNFLKRNRYGEFNRCYLHRLAADKLRIAVARLEEKSPGYQLLLFDCLRPRSVQKVLWDAVAKTPQQKYVADPSKGSVHNFGFAIDLSLLDPNGREVDMGTAFDSFVRLSEPALEAKHLKDGSLTQTQLGNRLRLRAAMSEAGFIQQASEWWHFDALPGSQVRKSYKIVE